MSDQAADLLLDQPMAALREAVLLRPSVADQFIATLQQLGEMAAELIGGRRRWESL
ncbi:MAG: hypothetical protein JO151_21050 [Verrucomicrobia bacterium]|nr:hypothetical protein [Verrucomicrobiota bacterium]